MASATAPLAFGVRAPSRGAQGAFRLGARPPRVVAVGRVPSSRHTLGRLPWGSTATAASVHAASVATSGGVSFDLLGLAGGGSGATAAAAAAFERVDDVVMGGVSSSSIGPDLSGRECLVWSGKCRSQGGGFAGARSVALQTPLDLSKYDGISLKVGFESDTEPERRTWKATVRTQNDRGEMVYQATFVPTVVARNEQTAVPAETKIPWSNFRLVRGPTIIPDVPPLSAEQCVSVFGLGLIMSRFSAQGPMAEFREGPFRLAVHAMGVYSETPETAVAPVSLVDAAAGNAGKKASENRGSRNLVTFLLAPLFKIVFSEKKRRRKLARVLLAEQAGFGLWKQRSFGQKLKTVRKDGNVFAATVEGMQELLGDVLAATLALPLRLIIIALSKFARLMRAVKGQKQLPKMK